MPIAPDKDPTYQRPSRKELRLVAEAKKRTAREAGNLTVYALKMRLEIEEIFPGCSLFVVGDSSVSITQPVEGGLPKRMYLNF